MWTEPPGFTPPAPAQAGPGPDGAPPLRGGIGPSAPALAVGGYVPFSASDWPGRLAAVVFVQGCPWRCGYCHNPGLQRRPPEPATAGWPALRAHLGTRAGLLDGVVFSGGEPTLDAALPAALDDVRALGFATGLHTAGISPTHLRRLLPRVDWVALDVKTEPAALAALTCARRPESRMAASLRLVLDEARACELRTTWHPRWLPEDALLRLADWLAGHGVRRWVVQRGRLPDRSSAPALAPALLDALCARIPEVVLR